MTFQIHALDPVAFRHLFQLDDEDLAQFRTVRQIVKEHPGTPCRVSLHDVKVGEEVLLLNYQHLPDAANNGSPYQSSHAIYVSKAAEQAQLAPNEVPAFFRHRVLSLRAFDKSLMMVDATVSQGTHLEQTIDELLDNSQIDFIHIHFAGPGCFAASVTRTTANH